MLANAKAFHVRFDQEEKRPKLVIHCDGCAATYEAYMRPGISPVPLLRSARAQGWELDDFGAWARCPEHTHGSIRRKGKRMNINEASPSAMRQQAQMVRLLDEHFDAQAGLYAAEWSDERIAAVTKLAVQAVTKFREAAYGPQRNPEIEAALREITKIRDKVEADTAAAISLINGAKAEALGALSAIEARLARLNIKRVA